jgi:hypothetical protein
MLPAIFRSIHHPCKTLVRNISYTAVRRMPFAKNEIVPDVIPEAPKEVAKVNYISGGN